MCNTIDHQKHLDTLRKRYTTAMLAFQFENRRSAHVGYTDDYDKTYDAMLNARQAYSRAKISSRL